MERLLGLGDEIVVEEAHDDADVGLHPARVERDVEVRQIVVGGADDRPRRADVGLLQRAGGADVLDEHRNARRPDGGDEGRILAPLDHHDRHLELLELLEDAEADAPRAADDYVILEGRCEHREPLLVVASLGEEEEGEADQALGDGDDAEGRNEGEERLQRRVVRDLHGGLGEEEEVGAEDGPRPADGLAQVLVHRPHQRPAAEDEDREHDERQLESAEQRPEIERLRMQPAPARPHRR